jgi:protein TonB
VTPLIRRKWVPVLVLGFLVALIAFTVQSMSTQHAARSETTTAVARKPGAPAPVTTTAGVPNPQVSKAQAQTSAVEPMSAEEVERIVQSFQDVSPKPSSRRASAPTSAAKKSLPGGTVKTQSRPVGNAITGGRSTNALANVPANASISPVAKTQQQATSGPPPTPPQLETSAAQSAALVPHPSNDARANEVRAPEPESKAISVPAANQPATSANVTGAVAILAYPYPSLRIPNGSSKKQRQGTSLQLGHLLSRVEPVYPEDAKQQGIQGTVKLHAVIDRHGAVQSLQSANGPPVLVAAAMNAVRQWRFSETLLAGQSVETEEDIDIVSRLSNQGAPRN